MSTKNKSTHSWLLPAIHRQIDVQIQEEIYQHITYINKRYRTKKIICSEKNPKRLFSLIKQMRRDCTRIKHYIEGLKDLAKHITIYLHKPQTVTQFPISIKTLESLYSVLQENRLCLEKKFVIPVPYIDTP